MTPRTLRVIGIGPGGPRQITLQAIDAMQGVDVFLVLDKGSAKQSLTNARAAMLDRHVGRGSYRLIEIADPPRDRNPSDYHSEVARWHTERSNLIENVLRDNVIPGGVAAILVWGDPALYDSTLRIADAIAARGRTPLAVDVVPGVTSVSALTAAHGIVANRVGEPIHVTTGRRLAQTPAGADTNQVVMLDADCTFLDVADPDDEIYWGAYLGTSDEMLMHGKVREVGEQIRTARAEARAQHGWIMDTYLLRRRHPPDSRE